jgi:hypothetical protein
MIYIFLTQPFKRLDFSGTGIGDIEIQYLAGVLQGNEVSHILYSYLSGLSPSTLFSHRRFKNFTLAGIKSKTKE